MARSGGAHRRHRAVHQSSPLRRGVTRAFMTLVSTAAVLMTGAGYYVAHGALGGITVSQALSPDDPRSSGDNMNILLIGLDSRKDQDGNDLPNSILKQLHAGDSDDGGYKHQHADTRPRRGRQQSGRLLDPPRRTGCRSQVFRDTTTSRSKEAYGLTKQYVSPKARQPGREQPKRTRDERPRSRPGRDLARGAQPDRGTDRLLRRGQSGRLLRSGAEPGWGQRVPQPRRLRFPYSGADFPRRAAALGRLGGAGFRPATSWPGHRRLGPHPSATSIHFVGNAGAAGLGLLHQPGQDEEPDGSGSQKTLCCRPVGTRTCSAVW